MNPIEQIKQEIAALQKKVAELEKQPEELTRDTGMPNAKTPNYIILSNGITTIVSVKPETDYERYSVFETNKEALAERDYTLASRRVRAWAKAVNGERKADWNDEHQVNYGVECFKGELRVGDYRYNNGFIHQISFPTKELAEKFLELFRAELEILAKP